MIEIFSYKVRKAIPQSESSNRWINIEHFIITTILCLKIWVTLKCIWEIKSMQFFHLLWRVQGIMRCFLKVKMTSCESISSSITNIVRRLFLISLQIMIDLTMKYLCDINFLSKEAPDMEAFEIYKLFRI